MYIYKLYYCDIQACPQFFISYRSPETPEHALTRYKLNQSSLSFSQTEIPQFIIRLFYWL